MSDPAARLVAVLVAERERRGLTQAAVAVASGLHPSVISLIECGRRDPQLSTLLRLAGGIGVEVGIVAVAS